MNLYIYEAQQTPSRINLKKKKIQSRHIIIQLPKAKERILKAIREKQLINIVNSVVM